MAFWVAVGMFAGGVWFYRDPPMLYGLAGFCALAALCWFIGNGIGEDGVLVAALAVGFAAVGYWRDGGHGRRRP